MFFDTVKLSDSETEKRLRNGPFAENARWQCLARVLHALQRSAPDNLSRVACGVLKPSAEQQGVQEQRQDGVLGGPRIFLGILSTSDVERSPGSPRMLHGHLHQLHAPSISCMHVESPGFSQHVTTFTGEI